ncbi:hypothetical protein ACFE04_008048 [Oxalis oulophora]
MHKLQSLSSKSKSLKNSILLSSSSNLFNPSRRHHHHHSQTCNGYSKNRSFFTSNSYFSSGYGQRLRLFNENKSGLMGMNNRFVRKFSCGVGGELERESMEYDVVIVGAGPAGLSAAIKLKQICRQNDVDLSVCVVEKGAEVGRVTLLAEGCRGSLSEKMIKKYKLREKSSAQHQTYALGIKEVWEIEEGKHKPGTVLHTLGWPLDHKTYGGSFLYHMDDRQISLGFVVGLNYHNPFLNPYEEFQRFKCHPAIKPLLQGGNVLQYGARTLNEGGFQSIPYPVFPGGAIIGCSAGFLNVPKIKGTHTAMKSGMLAAEATFRSLHEGSSMETYWDTLKNSWVWEELRGARNYRPAFEYGLIPGLTLSGLEHYILRGKSPYTLKHGKPDHEATDVAQLHSPIHYPKPDGVFSFDVPTSLFRSNTNHDHNQPPHLRLRDPKLPEAVNLPEYAGPESRYCPARVYEYVANENGKEKLHINAQNCLHCKACDIKDPKQNIEWTVPEGGGGPGYSIIIAVGRYCHHHHQMEQNSSLGHRSPWLVLSLL